MRNLAFAVAAAGALSLSAPSLAAHAADTARRGPGVVARVNGEPVLQGEFQRMLENPLTRQELEQEIGTTGNAGKRLEQLALQRLIYRRLLLQEAGRRGMTVSDEELDTGITSLRRRFDDLKSFGQWMKAQGLDDKTLFETVRAEMLSARVAGALVADVRVTPEQVQEYYAAHKEDLKIEEVWIQIITVKDRSTAESIQAALRNGEDFGRLAQQKSVGVRAPRGGDVGWVNAETLWPPMREALASLRPGQAIGPLQKGEEFLIARLHERRFGRAKTLDEARPEVERRLLSAKQQAALRTWLSEQEKNSKIEVYL